MTFASKLADRLFSLPARSDLAFRIARRIVARHQGEGDSHMGRNGELRAFARHRLYGGAILDVGANTGEWARAVQRIAPKAPIHCFEPALGSFAKLAGNVQGATLNNVAVGAQADYLDLHIYSDAAETNTFHAFTGSGQTPVRTQRVEVITLDDYARDLDAVDYLKIDTEGHELAVLTGAAGLLNDRRVAAIQFEYSGWYIESRTYLRDVWEMLKGYEICKILPHGVLPLEHYSHELENYRLANYLAILRP